MSAVAPEVRRLENCQRPALVRMAIGGAPEWVFLGLRKEAPELWPAFVVGGFRYLDLTGPTGLQMRYEDAAVLSFKTAFKITPHYDRTTQVDEGPLFTTPGALLLHNDEAMMAFARGDGSGRTDVCYLSLTEMRLSGERAKPRFAFASWSLTLDGSDKPLLTHTVPDPSAK